MFSVPSLSVKSPSNDERSKDGAGGETREEGRDAAWRNEKTWQQNSCQQLPKTSAGNIC